MKTKRKIGAGIGVLAVVGLFLGMRSAASWRPVTLAGIGGWPGELTVSRDGDFVWMGEVGGVGQAFTLGPIDESEQNRALIPPEGRDFQLYKGLETWPRLVRRYDGTHFQSKHAGPSLTLPRCAVCAFSLPRGEIYLEQLDSEQGGGFISIWDMTDSHLKRRMRYSRGSFSTHSTFSPDGKWLLSAQAPSAKYSITVTPSDQEASGTLRRYDVQSAKLMSAPDFSSSGGIGRVKFSPDGKFLLVGPGLDNPSAMVSDASSWKQLWFADGIVNADWLPDNQLGVTTSQGLEWRDAATGAVTQTRLGPLAGTKFWTTSPDEKWIYAGDDKQTIRRWRAK